MSMKGRKALSCRATRKETGWTLFLSVILLACSRSFKYAPVTFEGPWYTPWWGMFFYEASSWEYSLSIPHDVPGLIEKCGGAADFEKRLDIFFDKGFFNVNNEPSFLTPCLYHWLGKPWRSSDRIREILQRTTTTVR